MQITSNDYDTPKSKKRSIIDFFTFNTRYYFYLRYLYIILLADKKVKQGLFDDQEYCKTSDRTFNLVETSGGKISATGLDNIKNVEGPVVFVGNHMSILETFILPGLIIPFKPVSFIVKQSLIEHKFFGRVMKATRPIAVSRTNPKQDLKTVLSEGSKLLSEGRSIIVFPQSTRGKFVPKEFGTIGNKLAEKNNATIIPVALKTDLWTNGKMLKDFGKIYRNRKVYIEFGTPLTSEMDKKELHSKIIEFIGDRLNKWS